jgi:hypothetical protein
MVEGRFIPLATLLVSESSWVADWQTGSGPVAHLFADDLVPNLWVPGARKEPGLGRAQGEKRPSLILDGRCLRSRESRGRS